MEARSDLGIHAVIFLDGHDSIHTGHYTVTI